MKKILVLLAAVAMVGFVSCKKDDPTPAKKDPVTATINASDVTVEEGKTASIGATTNSSAPITYASDNTAVATVSAAGEVTGVKAGSATITLKVAAVEEKFTAAEKTIKVTVTAPAPPEPPTPTGDAITVDGEFEDWSALETGTYTKAVSDPDAPWEGVKEIRCYATPEKVYYYIQFDADALEESLAFEYIDSDGNPSAEMHIRLCINTDGEYESGYANYFLEAYDFIIEGAIADEGHFIEFDGTLHQRIGSWNALMKPGNELVYGTGNGTEYEIWLDRAKFNEAANTSSVPMPMGDEFQTGIRFYNNGWDEFSNMPNSSVEEEAGNGWGYLMRIHTNK